MKVKKTTKRIGAIGCLCLSAILFCSNPSFGSSPSCTGPKVESENSGLYCKCTNGEPCADNHGCTAEKKGLNIDRILSILGLFL